VKRIKKFFALLVVLGLVFGVIIGCGATTEHQEQQQESQEQQIEQPQEMVLRYNLGTEPETLDPAKATGVPEMTVMLHTFDGLTRLDKDGKPVPAVAERWDVQDDGKTYIFYLRKDVKWSDGKPVTAYDFEFAWKRALSPEIASEYAYQLYYIKNGEKYNTGEITDPNELGIEVVDDYTLKVELEQPAPYFLSLVAFPTLYPLPKHVLEANPDWPKGIDENPSLYVTNGPFLLEEWRHHDRIILKKNPDYFDKEKVKLDKLIFFMVEDENTAVQMFENGEVDVIDNIPTAQIDMWKGKPEFKIDPILGTYYILVNVGSENTLGGEKNPLLDVRVRKAIAMAINRSVITDKILKAGQQPAYAFVPPGIPDAEPGKDFREVGGDYFSEDIEKAKQLLAEAGYPNGEGFPKLIYLYNTSEGHKKIGEAIQSMLKENLGIEIELQNQEWKVYLQSRNQGQFDLARAGWLGDYVDPMTFLDMFVSTSGTNDTGWSNPQYDELIEKAKYETDNAKRVQYMHEAEAILMQDMPIIPLYFYTNPRLVKTYVKNYAAISLGWIDFKEACIEK